jgi:hypothetical protein
MLYRSGICIGIRFTAMCVWRLWLRTYIIKILLHESVDDHSSNQSCHSYMEHSGYYPSFLPTLKEDFGLSEQDVSH